MRCMFLSKKQRESLSNPVEFGQWCVMKKNMIWEREWAYNYWRRRWLEGHSHQHPVKTISRQQMNFQRKVQRAVRHSTNKFHLAPPPPQLLTKVAHSLESINQSLVWGPRNATSTNFSCAIHIFAGGWLAGDIGTARTAERSRLAASLSFSRAAAAAVCVILIYVLRRSESARPACDCGKITLRASSTVQHARRRQPHACTHGWTDDCGWLPQPLIVREFTIIQSSGQWTMGWLDFMPSAQLFIINAKIDIYDEWCYIVSSIFLIDQA